MSYVNCTLKMKEMHLVGCSYDNKVIDSRLRVILYYNVKDRDSHVLGDTGLQVVDSPQRSSAILP